MSLTSDLRTYLLAQAGVSTLIGTRLHPIRAPQAGSTGQSGETVPYVTYQTISDEDEVMLQSGAGFADARVQLTAWSRSKITTDAIVDALRDELLGFGNAYMGSTNGTYVFSVRHGGNSDVPSAPETGDDVGHYGVASDWIILHRRSVPTF